MKPKATTLQERMGFRDDELSTPRHDEIMLWLDSMAGELFPYKPREWDDEEIMKLRCNALANLVRHEPQMEKDDAAASVRMKRLMEDPPKYPQHVSGSIKTTWECPVTSDNKFIVGFVDMTVTVHRVLLSWQLRNSSTRSYEWSIYPETENHLIEVKPEIKSLGEVIRQVRTYQVHASGKFYVCCPDDRFESALKSQGIGFIKAELSRTPKPA